MNTSTQKITTQESEIKAWVVNYISNLLDIPAARVDADKPYSRFGLDSASIAAMTGDLAQWLKLDIEPSIAYDHPTINKLSAYLAAYIAKQAPHSAEFIPDAINP